MSQAQPVVEFLVVPAVHFVPPPAPAVDVDAACRTRSADIERIDYFRIRKLFVPVVASLSFVDAGALCLDVPGRDHQSQALGFLSRPRATRWIQVPGNLQSE